MEKRGLVQRLPAPALGSVACTPEGHEAIAAAAPRTQKTSVDGVIDARDPAELEQLGAISRKILDRLD